MTVQADIERSFRQHYAEQVAVLSHTFGVQHIELVEDCVQNALLKALDIWPRNGQPENPSGWLFRVARNEVLMALRTGSHRRRLLDVHQPDLLEPPEEPPASFFHREIRDELLRMMLVVCDPEIPVPSQIAFALKILCGFSVREIAHHLFISDDNVYKRLQRARRALGASSAGFLELSPEYTEARIDSARRVLYALFTEGHLSTSENTVVRTELCDEAMRLTTDLAEHDLGAEPETFALLALMHLHRARMNGRQGPTGGLLLLDEQDRSLWDQGHIEAGIHWLAKSAVGQRFTRFHAEAGIAAEHCLAPSFSETRWSRIVQHYERLERYSPSPVHRLNRAIAVAEWQGPDQGLSLLEECRPPTWLAGSYLWVAALGDLHRRCGHLALAIELRAQALALAPNEAVRTLLSRRLALPQQLKVED